VRRVLSLAGLGLLLSCSSFSPSQYVSPRINGRVVDMETGQPMKDVQVRRLHGDDKARPQDAAGGRLVETADAVRTGKDGRFTVPSVRTLGPLGGPGWYSVSLNFVRSGYQSVVRSYTLSGSTNTTTGEPVIQAGDVSLPRLAN